MRIAFTCLAMALALAPQLAAAAVQNGAGSASFGEAPNDLDQTRFNLAPGSMSDEIVVTGRGQRKFSPGSRGNLEAEVARFGDGEIQYIEGPAWDYQTSRRGPKFEVAALGGGMENAPYLAHVAMNWRF